jgi:predicted RNase H-like HicB family nuclease
MTKERFNYTKDKEGKGFVAQSVNLPGLIVQAKTLEGLKQGAKDVFQAYLKHLIDVSQKEEFINLVEVTEEEFLKTKE